MSKEIMMAEIIQIHAKRKGISQALKKIKSDLDLRIESQKYNVGCAKSDFDFVSSHNDRGIYNNGLKKAEAKLSTLEALKAEQVDMLTQDLVKLSIELSKAKSELFDCYGQSELDKVNSILAELGSKQAKANMEASKQDKVKRNALKQLLLSLTSARYDRLIRLSDTLLTKKDRTDLNKVSRTLSGILWDIENKKKVSKDRAASIAAQTQSNKLKPYLQDIGNIIEALESSKPETRGEQTLVQAIVSSHKELTEN